MSLAGYQEFNFSYDGRTRTIFYHGSGPGVIIMHEIPGITPEVMNFGRRVAAAGFTAVLPWMFGVPGRPLTSGYALSQLARVCISREFYCFAKRRSSPITDWLRGLCRQVHDWCGGPGVGAVGMCLTGGFALSLMVDEVMMASVLSQPSLPLSVTPSHKAALGISDEEFTVVKRRAEAGCSVLGLRFTCDPLCPSQRFASLRKELGSAFESIEIDSSPGNSYSIKSAAHSVLTTELVDQDGHPTHHALEQVLSMFREKLLV